MDEALQAAEALTAKLLERAIDIVEGELGAGPEHRHAPVISAVLLTLAASRALGGHPASCRDVPLL